MDIKILKTGSSGNCSILWDKETKLIIDCGLKFNDIRKGLFTSLGDIDGTLITHHHSDHAKSFKKMIANGVKCYMGSGTMEALETEESFFVKQITPKKRFRIKTFDIMPFELVHYNPNNEKCENLGFYIHSTIDDEYCVWATDTHYIPYSFPDVDYFAIECNYINSENIDLDDFNAIVDKRRFISHQSLETAYNWLLNQNLDRCKKVYLIHVSDERGNKAVMKERIEEIKTIKGKDFEVII